jgi:hypothetical protein
MWVVLDLQSPLTYNGLRAYAVPSQSPGNLNYAGLTAFVSLRDNQGGCQDAGKSD